MTMTITQRKNDDDAEESECGSNDYDRCGDDNGVRMVVTTTKKKVMDERVRHDDNSVWSQHVWPLNVNLIDSTLRQQRRLRPLQ